MRTENWKKIVTGCGMVLLAAYVGGFFEILFSRSEVCLSPLQCLYAGCGTSSGRKWSMAAVVLLLALTVLVIWRGKDNPLHDERNSLSGIPLASAKLGTDHGCSDGHIERL